MALDELNFVTWLRARTNTAAPGVIGDDMAVVEVAGAIALFSSDMLLDGRHFDTREHPYDAIGRKSVNSCLSDCAAMAVRPVAVTVSLALSTAMSEEQAKSLMDGALEAAGALDVTLAGGDTTRWNAPLAIDVAVVAEPYPEIEPVMRSGARPRDGLYVTGPLGGSRRSRHLSFTPRIREALALARLLAADLHAMIDVTDGLSLDLWRMCDASGAGAALDTALLEDVTSEAARTMSASDGITPLDHVLSDGEDFELLLAVADSGDPAARAEAAGLPLFRVGTVTEQGLTLIDRHGHAAPLQPRGFVH